MEFIQPVFINKDEFFIRFDDMTIQEKVKDVQVAIIRMAIFMLDLVLPDQI